MNRKKLFCFLVLLIYTKAFSQRDSICINAKMYNGRQLSVDQSFFYKNKADKPISKIKLLNWVSAYKSRTSPLAKRKIEDRKNDLYFAKKNQLGKLENLKINDSIIQNQLDEENIYISLKEPLNPGESIKLNLEYLVSLPDISFTSYGVSDQKIALKYFFIIPDGFENGEQAEKYYYDIEETQNGGSFWKINLEIPENYFVKSNLKETEKNNFEGTLSEDPEFLISKEDFQPISSVVDGQKINFDFGYKIDENQRQALEFYLPLQLKFLKERLGFLPENIFISEKFKNKEDFFGNDDIKFWKFRYTLFTPYENADLDYFSILSKKIIEESFVTDKNSEHWFKNGLKSYLEFEYLKKFYPDRKILGDLPEQVKIFGIKPVKDFNIAKMKLTERYGIAYQYIMNQNLDQKIAEPFIKLSNMNQMVISNFETGSLLHFISEKMGASNFDSFLVNFLSDKQNKRIDTKNFLDQLAINTRYSSAFLENYLSHKNRSNFKLKNYHKFQNYFEVEIAKNTAMQIPIKIETQAKDGTKSTLWYDTSVKKENTIYTIPQNNAYKITMNDEYAFPEKNFRDNYLYTKGFFANMKKIRFRITKDIPNPEFNEIYLNPRLNFNAYDKILVGLNFKNTSLFDQKFSYSFTPYYSTGTGKLTGSGGVSYAFQPAESFFRNLVLGASGSYFHYDYDLAYRKFSTFASMNFNKDPRSSVGKNFGFSYEHFEKDLSPLMVQQNEYKKYNLWNVGYGYSDSGLIHEKSFGTGFQWMEDFAKISTQLFYRWEFSKNKKIGFRFFGGYFLRNNARNNLFDFGVSRVSNYSFSYGLLGQSATKGILSQQFVLADGGFKSVLGNTANQFIASVNVDSHLWKMFNVYADAGIYKNYNFNSHFIWDTGVKLKIIPDFFEIYFPVQSSLGFEPSFKDYGYRIRYTLIFNLGATINHYRRGWF